MPTIAWDMAYILSFSDIIPNIGGSGPKIGIIRAMRRILDRLKAGMGEFWYHSLSLFLACRAADAMNLAAGLWFVPRFVSPADLGAVMPLTSFATFAAMPVFAFAMAVMKETADLRGRGEAGRLKSLLRGVFAAVAVLSAIALAASAAILPRYMAKVRVDDSAAGFLVVAAALMGCVAPVYTDSMQALKRFGALGATEVAAAAARLATMAVAMPARALAGYFAGNLVQPLVRVLGSVVAVRRELAVPAESFWTGPDTRRLARNFLLILAYLTLPMLVSLQEQTAVRDLADLDSAGYYMATRLADFLNYLTLPVLLVMFPYSANAARDGRPTRPLVMRCWAAAAVGAAALCVLYSIWGATFISWMPNGEKYVGYAELLPAMLAINALNVCQTFYTNSEVAAGRFGFLAWFAPMNLAFSAFWALVVFAPSAGLDGILPVFLAGAALRFALSVRACLRERSAT